jgi:hypothetical protein
VASLTARTCCSGLGLVDKEEEEVEVDTFHQLVWLGEVHGDGCVVLLRRPFSGQWRGTRGNGGCGRGRGRIIGR